MSASSKGSALAQIRSSSCLLQFTNLAMSLCHGFMFCDTPTLRDGEDFAWARYPNPVCLFKDYSFLVPQGGVKSPENTGKNPHGQSLFLLVNHYFLPSVSKSDLWYSTLNIHCSMKKCKKHWAFFLNNEPLVALCYHFRPTPLFPCPVLPAVAHFQESTFEGLKCFMGGQRKG